MASIINLFEPALSVIPAKEGIQRLVGLDSRLRGNDRGVEFVQTYQGSVFVAMTRGDLPRLCQG